MTASARTWPMPVVLRMYLPVSIAADSATHTVSLAGSDSFHSARLGSLAASHVPSRPSAAQTPADSTLTQIDSSTRPPRGIRRVGNPSNYRGRHDDGNVSGPAPLDRRAAGSDARLASPRTN